MKDSNNTKGETLAIVSYLWLFGVIIAYFMNKEKNKPLVYFHVRQSLGLWLSMWIIGLIISNFDVASLRLSFWIFFGVLFFYGIATAIAGKMTTVPIVGKFYQNIFKSLGGN
ncbi:MAG: hypothetical protein HRT67_07340 [Flavobacteriaceae bacterium]|nr:hypothetical protein [Flavobacteriaceae bacterium]